MRRFAAPALSLLLLVIVLTVWELSVDRSSARYIPSPSQIWEALLRGFQTSLTSRAGWYVHIGATLYEAGIGLLIGATFGMVLGLVLAEVPFIDKVLSPYVIGLQVLPKVAIAPLLVLLLGFDLPSKVAIVVLLTFFPLLINTVAGINSVPTERIEVMRSLAASRWQILWMAKLPSALPFIFAGLQMATVFSLTGAIVGEFVGGRDGLGRLILEMNAQFDEAGIFAVLVILALLGALFHGVLRAIQRRVLFWSPENIRTLVGS
jgi:NitT/TauT family transport system permease protein